MLSFGPVPRRVAPRRLTFCGTVCVRWGLMILCVFIGASVDADGVGVDGLIGALVCAHTGAAITRAAAIAVPFSTYFIALILAIETLLRPCHAPKQAWRSANVRRIACSPSSRLPHSKVADYERASSPLRLDADQSPWAQRRMVERTIPVRNDPAERAIGARPTAAAFDAYLRRRTALPRP
jgi:hypothetical protein